ncbi:SOS response-associated peptidase family protein [Undibacterium sp. TS12]|uniref:SOS response-associated peptidase n=1 Tax=Undibacterium sp. TS12 TaxID=2908202 RepID=UPI001F4C9F52|nr:SOS response-associated peptidase family protein [Undibacterium sp. TS12]MCH8622238.1 SOS response-associated peptidase family protein [Undibacterium sp. TS12]
MCINFAPTRKEQLKHFQAMKEPDKPWDEEVWQDYEAPIICHDRQGNRQALLGKYSMVPRDKMPPGVKRFSTMNARAETLGALRSYAPSWQTGKLCLVPMQHFFEPNYESGQAERWRIGLHEQPDFAVAGLYKEWPEADGSVSYSFTQITINADDHPLMKRFHKPGEEKRSLVILAREDFDDWLSCRDPEFARAFLQPFPPEQMFAEAAPLPKAEKPPRVIKPKKESVIVPRNMDLFD